MKKYFLSLLLLLSLATAQNIKDRVVELYIGISYDAVSDSVLTREMPDERIFGIGSMMGLYIPIMYPFAVSVDFGFDMDNVTGDQGYLSGSFFTWYNTFLLTLDLDSHRISGGIKYHQASSLEYYNTDLNNYVSVSEDLSGNLGYVANYEYNFARGSRFSLGVQYEYTTFKDSLGNLNPDSTVMIIAKLKMIGWEGIKDWMWGPGYYY